MDTDKNITNQAEILKELYFQRDEELRNKFGRSLPFQDSLFDRWDRAVYLGFGSGTSVYNSSCIFGEVFVGENTWIGPYTLLDGSGGGLSIGSFCSISAGVQIYTHDTVMWALSGGKMNKRQGNVGIGDQVYIGSQSIISHGVNIGSQSVIAANSFVNADVPERTICGGSPARILGKVECVDEDIRLIYDRRL